MDEMQNNVKAQEAHRRWIELENAKRLRAFKERQELQLASITEGGRRYFGVANGDSWFDYPKNGYELFHNYGPPVDVIDHINAKPEWYVLNISHRGDTSIQETDVGRLRELQVALCNREPWAKAQNKLPDFILVSAGGNDFAGDQLRHFLVPENESPPQIDLTFARFGLSRIRNSYVAIFHLRNKYAPSVPIFAHTYDYPFPNGKGAPCSDPWLQPSFHARGYSDLEGQAIMKTFLDQFRDMLLELAANASNNFHVIDTHGTLMPDDWGNELHPYPDGFKKIADRICGDIKACLGT